MKPEIRESQTTIFVTYIARKKHTELHIELQKKSNEIAIWTYQTYTGQYKSVNETP